MLKRERIATIKEMFVVNDEARARGDVPKFRRASAPANMNIQRETIEQIRIVEGMVNQQKEARDKTMKALNELSSVINNLTAVRYLL